MYFHLDILFRDYPDCLNNLVNLQQIFKNEYVTIYENSLLYKIEIETDVKIESHGDLRLCSGLQLKINKAIAFPVSSVIDSAANAWGKNELTLSAGLSVIELINHANSENHFVLHTQVIVLKGN